MTRARRSTARAELSDAWSFAEVLGELVTTLGGGVHGDRHSGTGQLRTRGNDDCHRLSSLVQRTHEANRGAKSMPFWVLGNRSIPSILIETGFPSRKSARDPAQLAHELAVTAIVSGRPAISLAHLVVLPELRYFGSHGLERVSGNQTSSVGRQRWPCMRRPT